MATPSVDEIKTLSAGALRRALREAGIDPVSCDNQVDKMRAALTAKLHPTPAASGRKRRSQQQEPDTFTQASVPSAGQAAAATKALNSVPANVPADLAEWCKTIELRIATLECAVGVAAGSKLAAPGVPPSLAKYYGEGPDKEPGLMLEVDDVDDLNEAQLMDLAKVLRVKVEPGTAIRVLRQEMKQALGAAVNEADVATTPAAVTLEPGAIVKAKWVGDGDVYDPVRLIFKKGKQWMAHYPDNSCDLVAEADIEGMSDAPWELDLLDASDF